jgi:hypothetical protein
MGEKVGAVIVPLVGGELDVEAVLAHTRAHLRTSGFRSTLP